MFGCKALIHIPKEKRRKLDSKAKEVIFVRYCPHVKTYRFYDLVQDKVSLSRDAKFFENQFVDSKSVTDPNFYIYVGYDSVGEATNPNNIENSVEIVEAQNSQFQIHSSESLQEESEEYFLTIQI